MKINLKQIFSIVGDSRDISCEIGADELSDVRGYTFGSPVSINGRVYNRAGVVYLEYSVDFTLNIICDRCLKELEREYHFDFDHIVVPSINGENDDYIVADGESIDLNEIALTDLLLQLPTKNLCKDDCKGLCMVCGQDLNLGECDCLN
ncbi:MAG: DUF177 domain-containing protein [Ruminococcus sp.]|jgi:uncharacterized protein|nr:DUF177 domain-containing protein [Ruminococcus sp.]MBR6393423.1 DUF177 domain-containing protein [Ruminococcus sp.]MCR5730951.1 DUF177 domain-containing protein [Ruminococcus sp.]